MVALDGQEDTAYDLQLRVERTWGVEADYDGPRAGTWQLRA